MIGQWLDHGWPMVGQWFGNGWPMVGKWVANGWPTVGQWLANGWTMIDHLEPWLTMTTQCLAECWAMAGQWFSSLVSPFVEIKRDAFLFPIFGFWHPAMTPALGIAHAAASGIAGCQNPKIEVGPGSRKPRVVKCRERTYIVFSFYERRSK